MAGNNTGAGDEVTSPGSSVIHLQVDRLALCATRTGSCAAPRGGAAVRGGKVPDGQHVAALVLRLKLANQLVHIANLDRGGRAWLLFQRFHLLTPLLVVCGVHVPWIVSSSHSLLVERV